MSGAEQAVEDTGTVEVNMDYLSDEMFDVVEDFVSKGGDKTGRKPRQ